VKTTKTAATNTTKFFSDDFDKEQSSTRFPYITPGSYPRVRLKSLIAKTSAKDSKRMLVADVLIVEASTPNASPAGSTVSICLKENKWPQYFERESRGLLAAVGGVEMNQLSGTLAQEMVDAPEEFYGTDFAVDVVPKPGFSIPNHLCSRIIDAK
jgi:hypothetical protein